LTSPERYCDIILSDFALYHASTHNKRRQYRPLLRDVNVKNVSGAYIIDCNPFHYQSFDSWAHMTLNNASNATSGQLIWQWVDTIKYVFPRLILCRNTDYDESL